MIGQANRLTKNKNGMVILMNDGILICPICRTVLNREGNSLYCAKRHCFDISKFGSVTFSAPSGDDKAMVKARTDFLQSGAYLPFAKALAEKIPDTAQSIVDAGCGEGYYTNLFARTKPVSVYGFDLSKAAIAHAAKSAKGSSAFFAVAGIFDLPIADESIDTVFSIFAPISDEFLRILKPGGRLIIGAAGKRHLYELKAAIYSCVYENEGRRDLPSGMELESHDELSYKFLCEGDNIMRLFSMTPYYYKTSREDAAKLTKLSSLEITADFDIFVYKKQG